MSTPTRHLGRNGPLVSAIGLGAMSLGGAYGQQNTGEEKMHLLDRAWEIGQRFWDTADVYFDSEARIGEWFQRTGKRSDIFLATKFGLDYATGDQVVRSDPEYVRFACERSLKQLDVQKIDLYYCHRVDGKTPIEKTVEAMVELKKEGKIDYLGLSEVSASTIRRAHAVHPIAAVQVEYSLFTPDIEYPDTSILATCRELGISIVAYSPIGRGLLAGNIKAHADLPPSPFFQLTPKYSAENFPKVLHLKQKIEDIAERRGCTAAQVCLAWLCAQGDDVIPIPGTRNVKYLEENLAAASVHLTKEEVAQLRSRAEEAEVKGDRYPTVWMGAILSDTPQL